MSARLRLRRIAARWAGLSLLFLSLGACGDRTGFEVLVEPPHGFEPELDFDEIFVQVANIDSQVRGESYAITKTTPTPYRVYVWPSETTESKQARLRVELRLRGETVETRTLAGLVFKDGELSPLTVDFVRPL